MPNGKPRPDLLPADALLCCGKVMLFGVNKHGENDFAINRRPNSEYYAKCFRHLLQTQIGSGIDEESGLPHVAHMACDALIWLDQELRHGDVNHGELLGMLVDRDKIGG